MPVGTHVLRSREDLPGIPRLQAPWSRWQWEFDFEAGAPVTAILFLDFGSERAWVRVGRDPEMLLLPLRFEIVPFDRSVPTVGVARLSVRREVHGDRIGIQRAIQDPRLLTDPLPLTTLPVATGQQVSTGDVLELVRLDVPGDLRASVLMVPMEATRGGRTGTWRLREPLPSPHPEWLSPLGGGRRAGRCPRPR